MRRDSLTRAQRRRNDRHLSMAMALTIALMGSVGYVAGAYPSLVPRLDFSIAGDASAAIVRQPLRNVQPGVELSDPMTYDYMIDDPHAVSLSEVAVQR